MGTVWKAEHLGLGTTVAVKFIHADLGSRRPEAIQRFQREAKAAAQIDSPHVVKIFDFGLGHGGEPYMAMELLSGCTLSQWLERLKRLILQDTVRLVVQVARALDAAHRACLVHRDIKPENIFVLDDRFEMFVKVLDFGVAKHTQLGRKLTARGTKLGTPYYMSPEQIRSAADIDARADLWALAVVAYEALAGALPFAGSDLATVFRNVLAANVRPITTMLPPDAPAALDVWFAHAFHADIGARWQTARELAESLRRIIDPNALDSTLDIDEPVEDIGSDDEISLRQTFPQIASPTPEKRPPK